MVMCVMYLTEPSRRFLAHVVTLSCVVLMLFAFTYGLVAYNSRHKFGRHVTFLFENSPAKTSYMKHSFKKNVWMAVVLGCWCVVMGVVAFSNAGTRQRWSESKLKFVCFLCDLVTTLCLLALLASFFVNFFGVSELEANLLGQLTGVFSMYNNGTNNDSVSRFRVDSMQYHLDCCGLYHWTDWLFAPLALTSITTHLVNFDMIMFMDREGCSGTQFCYIPWSCCARNTTEWQCGYRSAIGHLPGEFDTIGYSFHPNGCYTMLGEQFSWFLRTSSLFWIGMFGCQLVIFISWRLFSTSMKSWYVLQLDTIKDEKHPGIAPGWFLPCCGYPAAVYQGEDNENVETEAWGVNMEDSELEEERSKRKGGVPLEGIDFGGQEGGGSAEEEGEGESGDKKQKGKKKAKKKMKKKMQKKKMARRAKGKMKRKGRGGRIMKAARRGAGRRVRRR